MATTVSPRWKDDAVVLMQRAHEIAHFRSKHTLHRALFRRDHVDLDIARPQRRRHLQTDETRADHERASRAVGGRDDGPTVGERAQGMHVRLICAGNGELYRLSAGRQQQPVVGNGAAVGENDVAVAGVDRDDFGFQTQVDGRLIVEIVGAQGQPVFRGAAGEIVFRQVRTVHGRRALAAQHHDVAAKRQPPQHLRRGQPGGAAADDHDFVGRVHDRRAARLLLLAPSPDENAAPFLLDLPDANRSQRRGARRLPGPQVEAGVMPGAADAAVDHEFLRQRSVIMAAQGVNGEDFAAGAHQQHVLVANVARQHLAGKVIRRNPLRQVRP